MRYSKLCLYISRRIKEYIQKNSGRIKIKLLRKAYTWRRFRLRNWRSFEENQGSGERNENGIWFFFLAISYDFMNVHTHFKNHKTTKLLLIL